MVGNRYQRHVGEGPIDVGQFGKVLAAVQGCQRLVRHAPEQRRLEKIDVEMQHIEFVLPGRHLVQHAHIVRRAVMNAVEAQAAGHDGHQLGSSLRIT